MKYAYSYDEEIYHGSFDTKEQAIAELDGRGGWVGECHDPSPPESWWNAEDWIEHVLCQDEYSGEWAEYTLATTKEQREELEAEVRKLMAAWLDRHDLRPNFFNVQNAERVEPREKPTLGELPVEGVSFE